MRVLGLCFGLALLLPVGPGIADQDAPTDARRPEATVVADASIQQGGAGWPALESGSATVAVLLPAAVAIAPAPLADSGDEMFIGTGDGSNGFWVRP